jgi:RNA polymerase sigma-70 factor (ECF subfamily)
VNRPATSPANVQPGNSVVGFSEPSTALDETADLVARIHSGDEVALEILLNRYLPALRRIVHKHLHGHARSMLDTDDIVQDALLSTLRRMPHFVWRTPGALLAYLRRAILNRIIDAKRKYARQGEWVALPDDCAEQAASPLQRVVDKEEILRYRAALFRLRPRDRQLIVMRMEQQLTYQEIGTQLRMASPNAARVALIRAMGRLVSALERV